MKRADPDAVMEEEPKKAPVKAPYMPMEPMMPVPKVDVPEDGVDGIKNKWVRFASVDFDDERKSPEFIEQQVVNCPGCGKKLSVKFGTDVAKCPACSSMFVLKKVAKEVPVEHKIPEPEVDEYAGLTEEERYLREAEEELRRMIEEA